MPHALKTFESTQQQFSQAELVGPPSRDQLLQRLFPPYDYAQIKEQGLDSIFYHDPVTGDDGLLHTFAGDIVRDSKGKLRSRGLHHEGASLAIWGRQPEGGASRPCPLPVLVELI